MAAESLEGFTESSVVVPTGDFISAEAKEKIKNGTVDRRLRVTLSIPLAITVCFINFAVFWIINKVINSELDLIEKGLMEASDRVIDGDVFLALIAAVVAEITPVLVLIVKDLFSGSK